MAEQLEFDFNNLAPNELEDRLTNFSESVGNTIQDLVETCGLSSYVGAVGIEVQFLKPMQVSSRDEEVTGVTSLWISPDYVPEDDDSSTTQASV